MFLGKHISFVSRDNNLYVCVYMYLVDTMEVNLDNGHVIFDIYRLELVENEL